MKIIKTEKYADTLEGYNPYTVDFSKEEEMAKTKTTNELLNALKDAIEASKVSPNSGKYTDQASIYRRELKNRGISFAIQDRLISERPSSHTRSRLDAVDKTHGIWKDMPKNQLNELMQDDRHMT